jgi:hypothetical protein
MIGIPGCNANAKMVTIEKPVDEKIEEELQTLDDEFQELKSSMSYIRKQGKDTANVEILCLDFAPRLRMARVTYEKKDIDALRGLLLEIRQELKESDEGSIFSHCIEQIKEAYEKIRSGDKAGAAQLYSQVVQMYKDLPDDMRRSLYIACLELKKRIEKNA